MNLTEELRKSYGPGVPFEIEVSDWRLHDALLDVASRYPDRAALDFFSRKTTYRQLVSASRRAATVLHNAGVRQGDRVAIILPNCPQHVAVVFATSMLGAIAVEHNPLAPMEELRGEFARHGAKVVITWQNSVSNLTFLTRKTAIFGVNLAEALPAVSRTLIKLPLPSLTKKRNLLGSKVPAFIENWDKAVRSAAEWAEEPNTEASSPALLIHTGGTTGVPKAVTLTHQNLTANAAQALAWVEPLHEGAEVFYAVLPLFHAFGFAASFLAGIRLGATIALFPKFDPAQMLLSQRRLPCTFFIGVPPIYDRLIQAAEELNIDLSSIRYSISGAMPTPPELAARWEKITGGYLIEGYGMSEASPIILGSPVSSKRRPSTLGIPFPSTEIRIVNPENTSEEVQEGEIGELIVRGPQVFQGYWNNPEETEKVLIDGWLHTGDLVKVVDGFVVMADRRKELIISGGFNIYPSQVEDVVRSMPGIEDVAVVGMPGGPRGEDVVAALVLEAGASLTLADVRERAEKSLAHYALPRQIVVVQELPRSQIGKVMRKRVREQLTDLQSGIEAKVADIASQVSDLAGQASAAVASKLAESRFGSESTTGTTELEQGREEDHLEAGPQS